MYNCCMKNEPTITRHVIKDDGRDHECSCKQDRWEAISRVTARLRQDHPDWSPKRVMLRARVEQLKGVIE